MSLPVTRCHEDPPKDLNHKQVPSPPLAFAYSFPHIWDAAVALCDVRGLRERLWG